MSTAKAEEQGWVSFDFAPFLSELTQLPSAVNNEHTFNTYSPCFFWCTAHSDKKKKSAFQVSPVFLFFSSSLTGAFSKNARLHCCVAASISPRTHVDAHSLFSCVIWRFFLLFVLLLLFWPNRKELALQVNKAHTVMLPCSPLAYYEMTRLRREEFYITRPLVQGDCQLVPSTT